MSVCQQLQSNVYTSVFYRINIIKTCIFRINTLVDMWFTVFIHLHDECVHTIIGCIYCYKAVTFKLTYSKLCRGMHRVISAFPRDKKLNSNDMFNYILLIGASIGMAETPLCYNVCPKLHGLQ